MEYSSANLISFFYTHWKKLMVVPFLTMVVAVVFSGPQFIKPLFESQVILFPSTTNSVSKALLPQTNGYGDEDIFEYGDEQQAEQLLQILSSGEIRDSVIQKFDLMNHYDIDPNSDYPRTKLFKEYENKIEFQRTQFMSVEINVLDTDPQIAADIANYISKLVDKVKRRVARAVPKWDWKSLRTNTTACKMRSKPWRIKSLNCAIKGFMITKVKAPYLTSSMPSLLPKGAPQSRIKELERRLDTLAKYGGKYVAIRDELQLLKEEEVKLKTKFDQAKVDVNQNLPATFKVDAARPAERKTYPKRSILILAVGFATFILMSFFLMVQGTLNELRGKS
jgi:uncharacterized protein involved in exopolysaccharide biosynthesis